MRALEPYCDEFLYTHVDTEGLMGGTNLDAILAVRRATTKRVTAAGGITTQKEIDELDAAAERDTARELASPANDAVRRRTPGEWRPRVRG